MPDKIISGASSGAENSAATDDRILSDSPTGQASDKSTPHRPPRRRRCRSRLFISAMLHHAVVTQSVAQNRSHLGPPKFGVGKLKFSNNLDGSYGSIMAHRGCEYKRPIIVYYQ